jgi:hypothetical protein
VPPFPIGRAAAIADTLLAIFPVPLLPPYFETDPFLVASGLSSELVLQLMSACRDDFQVILQSVDLR